jgi:predicted RNA binding protein YcfA (HicA-like mRNA interferase family)
VSPRQPVVSGQRLIKALEAEGWKVTRQRGSHVRLKKAGHRLALVVPLHKELRKGTLAGILRDADLGPDDLRRLLG